LSLGKGEVLDKVVEGTTNYGGVLNLASGASLLPSASFFCAKVVDRALLAMSSMMISRFIMLYF
jgi:hypothetical protein